MRKMAGKENMATNKASLEYELTGNTLLKIVVNGVEFNVPIEFRTANLLFQLHIP